MPYIGISLIALLITASGCVHPAAEAQPFSKYVGKKVVLLEPCEIWSAAGGSALLEGHGWYRPQFLIDSEFQRPHQGRLITKLDVGTSVYIEQVNVAYTWSGALCHALGRTSPSNSDQPLEFEYEWGGFSYIGRAPWEPDSVPDTRYVGWNGTGFAPGTSTTQPSPASQKQEGP
jgi:hypothetical protein